MDDLDLNTDDSINRTQKRITDLSTKVADTAAERDAANAKAAEQETARLAAEKERDFYASFTDTAAKYPNALEYKDKIKEKVMSGYSAEDAAVAVLASEGKFTMSTPPVAPPAPAGGGSAVNNLPIGGANKSVAEMTRNEKRDALLEAQKRGDISLD